MDKKRTFFSELMRRRVVKVLLGYVAVIWLMFEGLSTLFQVFEFPGYYLQIYLIVAIFLIPVVGWLSDQDTAQARKQLQALFDLP